MEDLDHYKMLDGYSESAGMDVMNELIWDGLLKAVNEGRTSYTEAEVQFYIRHTKQRLQGEDSNATSGFQE